MSEIDQTRTPETPRQEISGPVPAGQPESTSDMPHWDQLMHEFNLEDPARVGDHSSATPPAESPWDNPTVQQLISEFGLEPYSAAEVGDEIELKLRKPGMDGDLPEAESTQPELSQAPVEDADTLQPPVDPSQEPTDYSLPDTRPAKTELTPTLPVPKADRPAVERTEPSR